MHNPQEHILVPDLDSPYFPDINEFALTFNAYLRFGSANKAARVADKVSKQYKDSGLLPDDLDAIRAALFMIQRSWRDQYSSPFDHAEDKAFIVAILAKIHDLAGNTLPGPGDPYP